ncbi:uncharacterized protein [Blastocystis hominis]|uniref:Uncharacterized protein n=1 Tax=Blastocystis hominis TaxID=12968 RepID=D8M8Y3_BLAHO|nr:uncharacterized protein [Blastocystis hominis]CBK24522.2 unnamed protein product [Blastocystis hominis]|eukprot:XP_012898570.1 uncharacterized protein [Blastocystis hominis]
MELDAIASISFPYTLIQQTFARLLDPIWNHPLFTLSSSLTFSQSIIEPLLRITFRSQLLRRLRVESADWERLPFALQTAGYLRPLPSRSPPLLPFPLVARSGLQTARSRRQALALGAGQRLSEDVRAAPQRASLPREDGSPTDRALLHPAMLRLRPVREDLRVASAGMRRLLQPLREALHGGAVLGPNARRLREPALLRGRQAAADLRADALLQSGSIRSSYRADSASRQARARDPSLPSRRVAHPARELQRRTQLLEAAHAGQPESGSRFAHRRGARSRREHHRRAVCNFESPEVLRSGVAIVGV